MGEGRKRRFDDEPDFKLGQRVVCSAYVKKTGNHYETDESRETCTFWAAGAAEGEEVEDCHSCDKFVAVSASFKGVFVGVTTLCTKTTAWWNDPPYGNPHFRFSSEEPKPFAVVYYAPNKKRLVPLDAIWSEEEAKAIMEELENG